MGIASVQRRARGECVDCCAFTRRYRCDECAAIQRIKYHAKQDAITGKTREQRIYERTAKGTANLRAFWAKHAPWSQT